MRSATIALLGSRRRLLRCSANRYCRGTPHLVLLLGSSGTLSLGAPVTQRRSCGGFEQLVRTPARCDHEQELHASFGARRSKICRPAQEHASNIDCACQFGAELHEVSVGARGYWSSPWMACCSAWLCLCAMSAPSAFQSDRGVCAHRRSSILAQASSVVVVAFRPPVPPCSLVERRCLSGDSLPLTPAHIVLQASRRYARQRP